MIFETVDMGYEWMDILVGVAAMLDESIKDFS